ncbi:SDR family oxidoreductase [Paraburkholderia megapolitana]|uniref:NAD(P)-dependent dehydrogenase, short-chain alcohol dehydrogenase family n=1 Tax=Paraburkholderia megapolitana TaxID=420953 RepID=A0A1I3DPV0_9BURK|nr:SDR family oxidoreductase [Paraburkholderia megapolitana]QDQ79706.1 SDR family oxidoreductase [Paraburkholderia megapolitana]SFH88693.1 NAD(P)-dependent dehydrogenase, short-chain alcohol dehydrogenase family [Paraburkholderia megapolitana]
MASLKGQKIVVVGGSSGIGLGVAAAALQHGADVVIVGRSSEKLEAAQCSLGQDRRVTSFAVDITKEQDVARAFDDVGPFDHLVSTAGTPPPGDAIERIDIDVVRRFFDSKLISAVTLAKHAARTLRKGGSMTFTSGINKDRPPVPGGAVVAATAGSFGYFAHALALELAPTRVNVVSPGWVDTPMWDDMVGEAKVGYFAQMAARLPAGRIATPADVAAAYVYLMESELTTGETMHIDGGQRLV